MDSLHQEQFDLIGCGFGPANLALSVAIVEGWLVSGNIL
jgi:lysine/ornithine N-monooxygenase